MWRSLVLTGVALALTAGHGVLAQTAPAGNLIVSADSKVWVEGTSTVRDWKCVASGIDATMQSGPEGPSTNLARLVSTARVAIDLGGLDCSNDTMNEHMRKALRQAEHPTISFILESYTIEPAAALTGRLQLAGQTLPVEFPATITDDGTTIRLVGSKAINMKAWNIKPPSLMLGTMKVKETVTISFDLTVKR
jgi:polyisoprenoid-binding protein YceI